MIHSIPFFLLDQTAVERDQGMLQTLVMVFLIFFIFYLILWRPEQKRRKHAERLRASLKKGDKVVSGSLIGQIDEIKDATVILRMVDGGKVEMLKGAVTEILQEDDPAQ